MTRTATEHDEAPTSVAQPAADLSNADAHEARDWHDRHRLDVAELREHCRRWDARVPGATQPPTMIERLRIEIAATGELPSAATLCTLAGADTLCAVDRDAALVAAPAAEHAAHSWMLLAGAQHELPAIAREAFEVVPRLSVALAIRAWEPDPLRAGLYPGMPRKTRELANEREGLASTDRAIAALESALAEPALAEPQHDPDVVVVGRELTARARIEAVLAELKRPRDQHAAWIQLRTERAEREIAALDSSAWSRPSARLPPMIERDVAAARRQWWLPVAAQLRVELRWGPRELAELLLAPTWWIDLVPRVRARYDSPRSVALLEAISDVDRARS